uniref:Two pore segment channel 2 n=1 Tax=Oryzias latipes TaxID=8090 RepID=A0A3P9J8Z3_ORYLA
MYRCYYSRLCQWVLAATITVVLLLAFVERPSSLSKTSDLRHRSEPWNPPCGLTESIEMVCLIIFCLDLGMKSYLIGWEEFKKCKWLISYMVVLSISIIDWVLSISMLCHETLRVRRLFRPFFLLQNSSLMKKTLKCIKRTLPEIASVILLLALHLCLFTMIGMLLFAKTADQQENEEWLLHFRDLPRSITSLLVLLTTANNPDVMIPAYSQNRAYSIFFISFSVIGTYCLMNLLTAIIYNQFRGYLLMSLQTSIIRRRVGIRAAFQVLSCQRTQTSAQVLVRVHAVLKVMSRVKMKSYYRAAINAAVQAHADVGFMDREQFQKVFDELDKDRITEHPPLPQYSSVLLQKLQQLFSHYYLTVLGNAVALTNVMCICTVLVLNSEKTTVERNNSNLEIINLCFILYYLLEMCVKIFAFGGKGYLSYRNNIFDGVLTVLLLVLQVTIFIKYTPPSPVESNSSLWELVRLVNMLIVFRFLRIIPDIKLMALVASTLMDLVKNLRAFAGILVVVYYVFAVLGIWLFEGAIKPPLGISGLSNTALQNVSNASMECGTYEQLGYWPNNFDDFAAAIILLYNVMIVNNWQAFMDAYSRYTSETSSISGTAVTAAPSRRWRRSSMKRPSSSCSGSRSRSQRRRSYFVSSTDILTCICSGDFSAQNQNHPVKPNPAAAVLWLQVKLQLELLPGSETEMTDLPGTSNLQGDETCSISNLCSEALFVGRKHSRTSAFRRTCARLFQRTVSSDVSRQQNRTR